MESKADALFAPETKLGVMGTSVENAFVQGICAMREQKYKILVKIEK